ncbi:DUF2987 domain-containing protein [Rheinheimera sp.]|uniref:DUF2987 domain-containing protein n=1 Tax=Rheinheimera sp. TaxID=1869214 RepID=UPI0027B9B4B4|nr:DUF2987 domain-containing protein [Rheinheimera sp.]
MRFCLVLLAALLVSPSMANTQFNYDGFYARLKKSEKAEFSHITLAFMLQRQGTQQACELTAARITTDISDDPLTVAANGELVLPYSELLNNRKALIVLKQPEGAAPCDLNFRLRSRLPLDARVELRQLRMMHRQFDALLKELAGLGKYFLPPMTGVSLQFAAEAMVLAVPAELSQALQCEENQCQLDLTQTKEVADSLVLEFQQAPALVLPLLPRK